MGKSYFALAWINAFNHSPIFSPFQQTTAPSYNDLLLSGTTRSSSIPIILPNPSQTGQAPRGLLKLNIISVGSSNTIPSASNLRENSFVWVPFGSKTFTTQVPCPSKKAVSTESARRFLNGLSKATARRSIKS